MLVSSRIAADLPLYKATQVNSLSFSPKMPNMLTCGTSAGEVMLFDIANPRVPRQGFGDEAIATYRPSHRSAGTSEVLAVRFNHISDRILAVGFANGHAHIFDSRKQRAVMEMVDESAPRRVASLAWSPSNQTNIVLASDHDSSPTLQFWDLRMGKAPKLEYVGHSRGVTDVAWCPQQPSVIVSSGKDHQTILWDVPSGDRLGCFVPRDPGVMFQVRCRCTPLMCLYLPYILLPFSRAGMCHLASSETPSTSVSAVECDARCALSTRVKACAGGMESYQSRHIPVLSGRPSCPRS